MAYTKPMVLCYHMESKTRLKALQKICIGMGVKIKAVKQEEYLCPIGFLAGNKVINEEAGAEDRQEEAVSAAQITEEMLVMSGFSSAKIDELLKGMKKEQMGRIALKAVITPTNQYWNAYELYEELKREEEAHEAIRSEKRAERD